MQKITVNLWFDDKAEEAVNFYTSIFKNSKILNVVRYTTDGAKVSERPQGSVMTVAFQLEGQNFLALNGGPTFKFTEAISLIINCETQEEVDYFWENLSKGGEEGVCGWLKDKYGLSWQVIPTIVGEIMQNKDPQKVERFMSVLLKMKKLDIEGLKKAYEG